MFVKILNVVLSACLVVLIVMITVCSYKNRKETELDRKIKLSRVEFILSILGFLVCLAEIVLTGDIVIWIICAVFWTFNIFISKMQLDMYKDMKRLIKDFLDFLFMHGIIGEEGLDFIQFGDNENAEPKEEEDNDSIQ